MENLCQHCKNYLTQLKAQPWETIKLLCKSEARYCKHTSVAMGGDLISLYDKDRNSIITNSNNCDICVPRIEMITSGECRKHKPAECYYKKNSWGDEEHSFKEEPKLQINNSSEVSLSQLEQYFLQNNIKSMGMKGDKLIIEYNGKGEKMINQVEVLTKK